MTHLIEILLPVTETFGQAVLGDIRSELTHRFGGVTLHVNAPAEGLWKDGREVETDSIVVVEVMTDEIDRGWWANYRKALEQRFSQEEIVIRASQVERL
ncbi:hypothetical protein SAMN03159496_05245 [Rhizobium sp. NFR07]|uniref:hypothetical protein n=1 Tax=Rhizobium sp. NFR07 TaxID=1566262 RepID=UPI0008E1D407|nr:hypothetical protein [Rhizobium sp. NFR07]SFB57120.1 hypothetical protein SAMN03159496_05245 [Rhizobium sp. NFR07]